MTGQSTDAATKSSDGRTAIQAGVTGVAFPARRAQRKAHGGGGAARYTWATTDRSTKASAFRKGVSDVAFAAPRRTYAATKNSLYSKLFGNLVRTVGFTGQTTETATNYSDGRTNILAGVWSVDFPASLDRSQTVGKSRQRSDPR